jgi:hypothetical protein
MLNIDCEVLTTYQFKGEANGIVKIVIGCPPPRRLVGGLGAVHGSPEMLRFSSYPCQRWVGKESARYICSELGSGGQTLQIVNTTLQQLRMA